MTYIITLTARKKLIHDLNVWAQKPSSLVIEQFCDEYSISSDKLRYFARNSPDVYEAYYRAKLIIMRRRRVKSDKKLVKKWPDAREVLI